MIFSRRPLRAPDRAAISFQKLLERRYSRRDVLRGTGAAGALLSIGARAPTRTAARRDSLAFESIEPSTADAVRLPPGYTYDRLLRWGDSIFDGAPALDPRSVARGSLLSEEAARLQSRQFGYNCDAVHFFADREHATRGVLAVNNEYTNNELLFPGRRDPQTETPEQRIAHVERQPESVAFSLAALGVTLVEIEHHRSRWRAVSNGRRNRRITGTTPIELTGPAAAADLLRTAADAEGRIVLGTLANCAGGRTPWGTYLTAEENIDDFFGDQARLLADPAIEQLIAKAHRRFPMAPDSSLHAWHVVEPRFSLAREPCEALRFGWIVEIDPQNPDSRPKKRTALGRFCHEAATPVVTRDGRVAVYMGDDEKFEYVYKFVSRDRFNGVSPESGRDLLDHGTLYVARLDADGSGEWLPLVHEPRGPLNESSGFRHQADVLIMARAAADVLGATPMDRPEDIEVHPLDGRVYIACTKNSDRREHPAQEEYLGRRIELGPNPANPRPENRWGHIVELTEDDDDAGSLRFRWEVFLLAGDPASGRFLARYEDVTAGSLRADDTYFADQAAGAALAAFGCPDNLTFDAAGNLWIVTDGDQPDGGNNGCYVTATSGPDRGKLRRFMTGPRGAETCGCSFSPAGDTLFLSIQHPGEGGTLERPVSHWPDGQGAAPRPSVIAVRREDGEVVGT